MTIEEPLTNKRVTCDVFEQQAEHYHTTRERMPCFQAQIAVALSMLAGKSGCVLDIGCAAGAEIADLRSRRFRVVGIDLSSRMLAFARRRFAGDRDVGFCRADVENLPFSSESMDHVVCLGVFEFLDDYGPSLREILRVLKPGGWAVFAIPNRTSPYNVVYMLLAATAAPLWRSARRMLGRGKDAQAQPLIRRNLCVPARFRAVLLRHGLVPGRSVFSNYLLMPFDRFQGLNEKLAPMLEGLASVPLVRRAGSVYIISAQRMNAASDL